MHVDRIDVCSTSYFSFATSLFPKTLVVGFLAACFLLLEFGVLLLETAGLLLCGDDFLDKVLLPLLLGNAVVVFGWPLNYCANLQVFRNVFSRILFIMPAGIQDIAHPQKLQVSFQLLRHMGFGKIEPIVASILGLLFKGSLALKGT